MNEIALGGTGAYIINTTINIIKPLIPEDRRKWIPILALLAGVLYGVLVIEGPLVARIASGIGIGSSSVTGHEAGKLFKKGVKGSIAENNGVLDSQDEHNELGQDLSD